MSAELELHADEPASVALQIAPRAPVEESLTLDGDADATVAELEVGGDRVHVVTVPAGSLTVTYRATVSRRSGRSRPVSAGEAIRWRRQSRYCPSDRLERFVTTHLREQITSPHPAAAIGSWVHDHLAYEAGSSDSETDALDTLVAGAGVCRDFAHLTVALSRAAGFPARFVAVYAPGLDPMDFHAVAEVDAGHGWELVDATRLAPRSSMVRIATGADAADTALVTVLDGAVDLTSSTVLAVTDGPLAPEDPASRVVLA